MKLNRLLIAPLLIAISFSLRAADPQPAAARPDVTRLACVGDSITFGVGVKDRHKESWPAQLARLLGDHWDVRNFGVSGTTMMKKGDRPYEVRKEYQEALDFKPDVVVIALGTNDSKPQNLDTNPDDFAPSYREMIEKFRAVNPKIKIFACLPPPAFPDHWGIRENVISGKIIPRIREVAKEKDVSLIDLHTALTGKGEFFPDRVHPNEKGAALIAKAVDQSLVVTTH